MRYPKVVQQKDCHVSENTQSTWTGTIEINLWFKIIPFFSITCSIFRIDQDGLFSKQVECCQLFNDMFNALQKSQITTPQYLSVYVCCRIIFWKFKSTYTRTGHVKKKMSISFHL